MRTALLLLALAISTSLAAQARNTAYLELGGNGIIPTVNYERQFRDTWHWRVGFSVVSGEDSDGDSDVTYVLPVMVGRINNPNGNHHLETAAGLLFVTGDSQDLFDEEDEEINNVAGTVTIGYRYQKPGRGFVFRAGLTPIFDTSDILPWAGVSFGYRW